MFPIPKIKISELGPKLDVDSKLSLFIIMSIAGGIITFLSIIGQAGSFGGLIGQFVRVLLGQASWLLPLWFFYQAAIFIRLQKNQQLSEDLNSRTAWGLIFLVMSVTAFFNLFQGVETMANMESGGGLVGYLVYPALLGRLGPIAGSVLLLSLGLFGFFLISQLNFIQFTEKVKATAKDPRKFWLLIPDVFEAWKSGGQTQEQEIDSLDSIKHSARQDKLELNEESAARLEEQVQTEQSEVSKDSKSHSKTDGEPGLKAETTHKNSVSKNNPQEKIKWHLPSFDLLKDNHTQSDPGDVDANQNLIQETLESFGIQVTMKGVVTGPTVSQYTLKPASGVKLTAIDNLQRDLALAMAATSLRLQAPIPGKSLVGVEVPNAHKSVIRLKDLLKTKQFIEFAKPLPVALGSDVAGKPMISPITKMPHLLVAGATGSGKSVWINSMLLSLLYRYTPSELQLVLVDMKRVELKLYDHVPHLLAPVITDSQKAINSLKWAVSEMDRRYQLLEDLGKRNIEDYNEFIKDSKIVDTGYEPLPYVVLVIDELGDLMMLAKNEVEPIIVRLTQMARAVGIHLAIGTQRPDTNVVTGLIKANIPTRVAFTVASQVDSRVILDQAGAEKLLGQGDGLYASPDNIQPLRFQGCLVEENEVRKVVNFWHKQVEDNNYPKNLKEEVTEPPKEKIVVPGMPESSTGQDEDEEELYPRIRNYVVQKGIASTSMLQTGFGIGYPKARKIISQLEDEGVVGPANGSKPREVLVET